MWGFSQLAGPASVCFAVWTTLQYFTVDSSSDRANYHADILGGIAENFAVLWLVGHYLPVALQCGNSYRYDANELKITGRGG